MKKLETDVLIVGAGISGTVAALNCAKAGKSVIVVEKLQKIGGQNNKKIDITENLGLDEIFDELHLPHLGRFNKSVWYSPSCKFEFLSKVYDYYILRGSSPKSFDVQVAKMAKENGAIFFTDSVIVGSEKVSETECAVKIKKRDEIISISAKFIIGADGLTSQSLSIFGFDKFDVKGPNLIGYGGICHNINLNSGETHVLFDANLAPGGYFYIGKTESGIGLASVVVNSKMQNGKSMKKIYENFCEKNAHVKEMMKDHTLENIFVGSGKLNLLKKRVIGNVALVGDAGRTMDPIFGYGVRQAIISGYVASKYVINSLDIGNNLLHNYELDLQNGLLKDENYGRLIRKVIDRANNAELNHIFETISYLHNTHGIDQLMEDILLVPRFLSHSFRKDPVIFMSLFRKALF